MNTYLIAHTNSRGTGVAQVPISAKNEGEAIESFETKYGDERKITTIGIEGHEG
jgi:hypothetical protein